MGETEACLGLRAHATLPDYNYIVPGKAYNLNRSLGAAQGTSDTLSDGLNDMPLPELIQFALAEVLQNAVDWALDRVLHLASMPWNKVYPWLLNRPDALGAMLAVEHDVVAALVTVLFTDSGERSVLLKIGYADRQVTIEQVDQLLLSASRFLPIGQTSKGDRPSKGHATAAARGDRQGLYAGGFGQGLKQLLPVLVKRDIGFSISGMVPEGDSTVPARLLYEAARSGDLTVVQSSQATEAHRNLLTTVDFSRLESADGGIGDLAQAIMRSHVLFWQSQARVVFHKPVPIYGVEDTLAQLLELPPPVAAAGALPAEQSVPVFVNGVLQALVSVTQPPAPAPRDVRLWSQHGLCELGAATQAAVAKGGLVSAPGVSLLARSVRTLAQSSRSGKLTLRAENAIRTLLADVAEDDTLGKERRSGWWSPGRADPDGVGGVGLAPKLVRCLLGYGPAGWRSLLVANGSRALADALIERGEPDVLSSAPPFRLINPDGADDERLAIFHRVVPNARLDRQGSLALVPDTWLPYLEALSQMVDTDDQQPQYHPNGEPGVSSMTVPVDHVLQDALVCCPEMYFPQDRPPKPGDFTEAQFACLCFAGNAVEYVAETVPGMAAQNKWIAWAAPAALIYDLPAFATQASPPLRRPARWPSDRHVVTINHSDCAHPSRFATALIRDLLQGTSLTSDAQARARHHFSTFMHKPRSEWPLAANDPVMQDILGGRFAGGPFNAEVFMQRTVSAKRRAAIARASKRSAEQDTDAYRHDD